MSHILSVATGPVRFQIDSLHHFSENVVVWIIMSIAEPKSSYH